MGLKQRIVAEMLGVREETVHLWERGRARPLPRQHGTILRFLGYDPEPTEPMLGGRLKALRRRLGLTQVELADLLDLDEGTVRRWESGRRTPSRWRAVRMEASLVLLEGGGACGR